jgi:hypothetical protein
MFFSNIFPHENNTIYGFRFRCLVWLALALSLDSVNADGEFVAPAFGIGGTFGGWCQGRVANTCCKCMALK